MYHLYLRRMFYCYFDGRSGLCGEVFNRGIIDRATCACGHGTCAETKESIAMKRQRRKWQNWEQEYHLILWIQCICWMRSQILEIYFMEIEYKGN